MSGLFFFDTKFVLGEERETRLAKKRQVYARKFANETWRLKSHVASKPHRAARTILRTCLAKGTVQTSADMPQLCNCDRRGARKPSVVGVLVVRDFPDDGCCGRVATPSVSNKAAIESFAPLFDMPDWSNGFYKGSWNVGQDCDFTDEGTLGHSHGVERKPSQSTSVGDSICDSTEDRRSNDSVDEQQPNEFCDFDSLADLDLLATAWLNDWQLSSDIDVGEQRNEVCDFEFVIDWLSFDSTSEESPAEDSEWNLL